MLEAYSWGGLTSGPASRAIWLLFLPFIFINLAHWMLPPATRHRLAAAVSVALLRLIALSFTLTLMLAAVAVMDVTVWQCMGLDYCASTLGPLSSMASWRRGVQVALSALPLMVVIAVLWRLGREDTRVIGRPPHPAVMAHEVPLESGTFWSIDASVMRLRACHVMAWTAGLGALTLAVPARYGSTAAGRDVGIALLAANGVVLAVAVLTTAWNRATARGGVGADWLTRPLLLVRWVSLGLLVVSLVWVATAGAAYPPAPTHFPGLRGTIYLLLGAQVVLLLGLFVFTALSMRGRRSGSAGKGYRPALGGFTAPFVALTAWLIGGGFSVGVGLWTAQALGTAVLSTAVARGETADRAATLASDTASFADKVAALNADAPLIVPPPYFWAAVAIVMLIVAAFVTGLCLWWWITRRLARTELRSVLADYPGTAETNSRAGQVASSRAWASLTDLGAPIVAGLALFTVLLMLMLAAWYLSDSGGFASLPAYSPALTNASVFITVSLAFGLVLLAVLALRDRQLRRVVAVLWDVITFWPRANHPLTPPCYAERTVPELLDRVRVLTAAHDTHVVLAAHSQGSVIAAATLLQADEATAPRVALLTFGSPLRRMYARNFPAYFGTGALPRLRVREPSRWINLRACTDPIGSWVIDHHDRSLRQALDDVDYRLLDVESLTPRADGTYPPICGHSGFWTRQEYRDAVRVLEASVLPAGTAADKGAADSPTEKLL